MAVKLSQSAYRHAQQLIRDGHCVLDDRDAWSEHRPTADQENEFIEREGFRAYAKWHLGVDDEKGERTKGRYKFPYGDFTDVHRCGVLSAESRAAQNEYDDIEKACAHLHGMLEALRKSPR
jgi:O-glycosyl hydrolase